MVQVKLAQNTKWHSIIEVLEVSDLFDCLLYVQAIDQKLKP